MNLYTNKAGLARDFDISPRTVYTLVEGIRNEIANGRYNQYAITGRQINKAVFLDYIKYGRMLKNPVTRVTVPPFNPKDAIEMLGGYEA